MDETKKGLLAEEAPNGANNLESQPITSAAAAAPAVSGGSAQPATSVADKMRSLRDLVTGSSPIPLSSGTSKRDLVPPKAPDASLSIPAAAAGAAAAVAASHEKKQTQQLDKKSSLKSAYAQRH